MTVTRRVHFAEGDSSMDDETPLSSKHKSSLKRSKGNEKSVPNYKLQRAERSDINDVFEMREFSHTQGASHSHLFHLQMKDLVETFHDADAQFKFVTKFIKECQSFLANGPKIPEMNLEEIKLSLAKQNIILPMIHIDPECAYKFSYQSPIDLVVLNTHSIDGANKTVDVAMIMPTCLFQPKDYVNFRYFHKRAYFLSVVAGQLLNSGLFDHAPCFSYLHHDIKKPIILVKKNGISFRFIPCISQDTFDKAKLSSDRNNIRSAVLSDHMGSNEESMDGLAPTPLYNNAILEDMYLINLNHDVRNALLTCPPLKEAMSLAHIWCNLREMTREQRSFDSFTFCMLFVYLLSKNAIYSTMKPIQMLRVAWQFIADGNMNAMTLPIQFDDSTDSYHFSSSSLVLAYGPFNLTGHVTPDQSLRLVSECKYAIHLLQLQLESENVFAKLFLNKFIKCTHYDVVIPIRIDLPTAGDANDLLQNSVKSFIVNSNGVYWQNFSLPNASSFLQQWMNLSSQFAYLIADIYMSLLQQAFKDRVTSLTAHYTRDFINDNSMMTWPLDARMPCIPMNLFIGLKLNAESAFNLVEHGPSPEQTEEAKSFRHLWGDRSELRRFRDGSIVEAIVWSSTMKHCLPMEMAEYIAQRHLIGDNHKSTIRVLRSPIPSLPEGESLVPSAVFYELSKEIKLLEDLPLRVVSVQLSSFPHNITSDLVQVKGGQNVDKSFVRNPIPAIIDFESSGKWPDDLEAIKKLKVAFYIQLARQLEQHYDYSCCATRDFIDILKDTVLFRMTIAHDHEIILAENDNLDALALRRHYNAEPFLASQVQALAIRYPCFTEILCLARRWSTSHFFTEEHFVDVLTVLIVASLFLGKDKMVPPTTAVAGFLRFLEKGSTFDWVANPLVVCFDEERETLSMAENLVPLQTYLDENAATLKCIPMAVVSSYQHTWFTWTNGENPSATMRQRWVKYASSTLMAYMKLPFEDVENSFESLFKTPMHLYDAVIRLKTQDHRNDHSPKVWLLGFDPVKCYLDELNAIYGQTMVFFHDGLNVIAIVFKPSFRRPMTMNMDHPLMLFVQHQKTVLPTVSRRQAKSLLLTVARGDMMNCYDVRELIMAHIQMIGQHFVTSMKMKSS